MGMRISPLDPVAVEQSAELREGRMRRVAGAPENAVATRPERTRMERLGSVAANAARAVDLAQTAVDALAEIEARLRDIQDILAETGSRIILQDEEIDEAQERINRNIIELNVLIGTTRFFGVTLFGVTADDQQFEFPGGDIIVLTIPNLSIDRLGRGVENQSGFENLSQVNIALIPPGVRLPRGLTDAFLVTDAAIAEVRRAREDIQVFRGEVFESAFRALRAEREALGLAEPAFSETDIARASPGLALSEILRQTDVLADRTAQARSGVLLDLVA